MNESLILQAQAYAIQRRLELGEQLGSGKDGIVLLAKHKGAPGGAAIKALRFKEAYARESQVYERLASLGINSVLGFYVPEMFGSSDELRVIEMSVVPRPFILDFAGAYLDKPPQFPDEIWADWETEKREQFDERWSTVQAVMSAFEDLGIYLLDVSPSNIGFVL